MGITDQQAAELQREIDTINSERDSLYSETWAIESQLNELRRQQAERPTPRELLDAYYEKISNEPLTNEQKRELLKPEVLSSLSKEEYIALLKRLNPYFLSHVTRQGFRDHIGHNFHTGGMQEFHNGFLEAMKDERLLRAPLAVSELKARDEASVREYLAKSVLSAPNEEEARKILYELLHFSLASAPKFADKTAVHFAAQMVADSYYGGESGNEIFFYYPSDVLASQYAFAFNGWEKDFTRPQSEDVWNDVFVWPDTVDYPGIPVDAGMVFLPANAPVDPETGSKYASEVKIIDGQEKRVMIEDESLISSFVEWGKKIDDESPLKKIFNAYKNESNYYKKQELSNSWFFAFAKELQGLGFKTVASNILALTLIRDMFYRESYDYEELQQIIKESGAHWKRAENTIPSKDYWESYFTKNTDLRPKHIEYYDGNPTQAVYEFQRKNSIGQADTSKTEGQLLGFDDHHVVDMKNDPRANLGYTELVAAADKIIKEHYSNSAETATAV